MSRRPPASTLHPVVAIGPWLEGRWQLRRTITDPEGRPLAHFVGELTVVRTGPTTLRSDEHGTLTHRDQADGGTTATRRLHYDLHGARHSATATVRFDHGGRFHDLDLRTGRCEVTHPCGADTYHGTTEVHTPDRWVQVWRVQGPTKSYVSTTTAERAGGRPG